MSDTAIPSQPVLAIPKPQLWTGRVLTVLVILFLLFDVAGKFMLPPQVTEASVRIGVPVHLNPLFGAILPACTIVYAIPRTALLGAVLLTGYLGGAVAIQLRAGTPLFETLFPVIFGVFVWAAILLRDPHLRQHFPVRRVGAAS